MPKSLSTLKKTGVGGFDANKYFLDLRQQVAVASSYKGLYAVEVEVEGPNLPGPGHIYPTVNGTTWVSKEDGSLRNGGREYVLSQPTDMVTLRQLCEELFLFISRIGGAIQLSYRCSIHVHINMAGVKLNKLASFVSLWSCFENVVSNWCGESRSGSLFALRLCDAEEAVDYWIRAFKTGDFGYDRERRYLALNPVALTTFGSLEVRTMRGTDNADDIMAWVEILNKIYIAAMSREDPMSIVQDISNMGPDDFLVSVFGPDISNDLIIKAEAAGLDTAKETLLGFRRIQPLIYTLPWSDVLTEINKVYVPDPFGNTPKKKAPPRPTIDEAFVDVPGTIRRPTFTINEDQVRAAVARWETLGAAPAIRLNEGPEGIPN